MWKNSPLLASRLSEVTNATSESLNSRVNQVNQSLVSISSISKVQSAGNKPRLVAAAEVRAAQEHIFKENKVCKSEPTASLHPAKGVCTSSLTPLRLFFSKRWKWLDGELMFSLSLYQQFLILHSKLSFSATAAQQELRPSSSIPLNAREFFSLLCPLAAVIINIFFIL